MITRIIEELNWKTSQLKEGVVSSPMYGLMFIAWIFTGRATTNAWNKFEFGGHHPFKGILLLACTFLTICLLILTLRQLIRSLWSCKYSKSTVRKNLKLSLLRRRILLMHHPAQLYPSGISFSDAPGPALAGLLTALSYAFVYFWAGFRWLPITTVFGLSRTPLAMLFLCGAIAGFAVAIICEVETEREDEGNDFGENSGIEVE